MKCITRVVVKIILLGAVLIMSGCNLVTVKPAHSHGYSPPPHAPAHGYRHKHHGHDLVFDVHLGVYIVGGLIDHYYHHGRFYRYKSHYWDYSDQLDGKWHRSEHKRTPPSLSKKHHSKHARKGNNKHWKYNSYDHDD